MLHKLYAAAFELDAAERLFGSRDGIARIRAGDDPAALWRTLWEAGEPHGLAAGGYRAIDTLRLEKGYRVWAADITPDETPHEAGLGFCVAKDKVFAGRDALEGREPSKRLRCLVLEDPRSVALGNERSMGKILNVRRR